MTNCESFRHKIKSYIKKELCEAKKDLKIINN